MRGKLITFEGPEGSGKSTQVRLLYNFLKKKKFPVMFLREPGSTKISEKIRRILLNPKNKEMAPETEMLLYMASRSQLIKEKIIPAIKRGKIVICDRFLDSTLAYQGYGSGLNISMIKKIGNMITKKIRPNLTFFLDIETKKGLQQAGKIKDRLELKPLAYHKRVRQGYLNLVNLEPQRFVRIKLKDKKNKTQAIIREEVLRCLLKK